MSSRGWPHLPAAYDAVAPEYAATFSDELDDKPFDRELLDRLASAVVDRGAGDGGLVCDLGCGPGQVAGYLAARGCDVIGVDLARHAVLCTRASSQPAVPGR